ncbi:hypothetical protein [Fodinicola feengrottensis]|uniref:hypothetical protein n=1 Tax=Fodinicola feengrottensis TaxID=435914 RepID=UPI0013D65E8E|nr:hypothetical protein [Fodinicola feengrottensis]
MLIGGTTQLDHTRILLGIWTAADQEVAAATAAGYVIPVELRRIGRHAQNQLKRARHRWAAHLPDHEQQMSPAEEHRLADFQRNALDLITDMRVRRTADMRRTATAEIRALEELAHGRLLSLRVGGRGPAPARFRDEPAGRDRPPAQRTRRDHPCHRGSAGHRANHHH